MFHTSGGIRWSCSVFRYNRSMKCRRIIFSCSDGPGGGPCRPTAIALEHVGEIVFLASSGIHWSCSVFCYDRSAERRRTIFSCSNGPDGGPVGPTEIAWDTLGKSCFSHPVVSVGHVKRSDTTGARNIHAPFFHVRVGPTRVRQAPQKSRRTRSENSVSRIRWYKLVI